MAATTVSHALKLWLRSRPQPLIPPGKRAYHYTRHFLCAKPASDLQALLDQVASGEVPSAVAASRLSPLLVAGGAQAEDVGGFAKIDHQRRLRVGFPEVVFGEGKSAGQIVDILRVMIREQTARGTDHSPVVATRVSAEKWADISASIPGLQYHGEARVVAFGGPQPVSERPPTPSSSRGFQGSSNVGEVAVMSAGTSDSAVAEEAAILAELAGAEVMRFHDVGVAGIHRLLGVIPFVEQAGVAICVAGMDGAMPGVVAGLVKCPVVAVPTSVGYGAAMSGLAPLLTMLNACAPGVSVVNIDNGFGAAAFSVKLLKSSKGTREP